MWRLLGGREERGGSRCLVRWSVANHSGEGQLLQKDHCETTGKTSEVRSALVQSLMGGRSVAMRSSALRRVQS